MLWGKNLFGFLLFCGKAKSLSLWSPTNILTTSTRSAIPLSWRMGRSFSTAAGNSLVFQLGKNNQNKRAHCSRLTETAAASLDTSYCNTHDDKRTTLQEALHPLQFPTVTTTTWLPSSVLGTSQEFFQHGVNLYKEFCKNQDLSRKELGLEYASRMFLEVIQLEQEKVRRRSPTDELDCENLLIALKSLATTYAALGKSQDCFRAIDEIRFWNSCKTPFDVEDRYTQKSHDDISYQWIDKPIALKSVRQPLLGKKDSDKIIQVSRSDMLFGDKPIVYAKDLIARNPSILNNVLNPLLQFKIYPLLRDAFLSQDNPGDLQLCVSNVSLINDDGIWKRCVNSIRRQKCSGGLFSVAVALQDFSRESGEISSLGHAVAFRKSQDLLSSRGLGMEGMHQMLVFDLTLRPHRQPLGPLHRFRQSAPSQNMFEGTERAIYLRNLAETQQQLPISKETREIIMQWAREQGQLVSS